MLKNLSKKAIAWLLSVAMVITLMPSTAFMAYAAAGDDPNLEPVRPIHYVAKDADTKIDFQMKVEEGRLTGLPDTDVVPYTIYEQLSDTDENLVWGPDTAELSISLDERKGYIATVTIVVDPMLPVGNYTIVLGGPTEDFYGNQNLKIVEGDARKLVPYLGFEPITDDDRLMTSEDLDDGTIAADADGYPIPKNGGFVTATEPNDDGTIDTLFIQVTNRQGEPVPLAGKSITARVTGEAIFGDGAIPVNTTETWTKITDDEGIADFSDLRVYLTKSEEVEIIFSDDDDQLDQSFVKLRKPETELVQTKLVAKQNAERQRKGVEVTVESGMVNTGNRLFYAIGNGVNLDVNQTS